jgi:hypothetical protein
LLPTNQSLAQLAALVILRIVFLEQVVGNLPTGIGLVGIVWVDHPTNIYR